MVEGLRKVCPPYFLFFVEMWSGGIRCPSEGRLIHFLYIMYTSIDIRVYLSLIHIMSALPTGDSGYQLDDGEGRVLKMHPKIVGRDFQIVGSEFLM